MYFDGAGRSQIVTDTPVKPDQVCDQFRARDGGNEGADLEALLFGGPQPPGGMPV
ncbi:MAG: hypothetical protein HC883_00605 [Bdellovibrionaceae bacterium]|nr:hypothetical protein [Pseudobdellovibrionaceae bacterium]